MSPQPTTSASAMGPDAARGDSGAAGRFARVEGFVKIGDFEGSATAEGHEGWTSILGLQLGVERITGSFISSDKAVGSVLFDSIAVLKLIDAVSAKAFKSCLDGRKIPKVQIHVLTMLAGKPRVTLELELEEVNISGYAIGDSAEGRSASGLEPSDTVEFRFHKVTMTVNKFDSTGASKGKVQEAYTVGS